jgi:hypothetical protein
LTDERNGTKDIMDSPALENAQIKVKVSGFSLFQVSD